MIRVKDAQICATYAQSLWSPQTAAVGVRTTLDPLSLAGALRKAGFFSAVGLAFLSGVPLFGRASLDSSDVVNRFVVEVPGSPFTTVGGVVLAPSHPIEAAILTSVMLA